MSKTIIEIDENLSAEDKKRLCDVIDAYANAYNTKAYSKDEYFCEIYDEMYDIIVKDLADEAQSIEI